MGKALVKSSLKYLAIQNLLFNNKLIRNFKKMKEGKNPTVEGIPNPKPKLYERIINKLLFLNLVT